MEGSTGKAGTSMILPNYKLGKTVGIDLFGKVKIAEHVLTGQKVAIKIINHHRVKNMGMDEKVPLISGITAVQQEIEVLTLLLHPHIIRLYEVIESHSDTFLVMEYAKSGELFDYIVEKGRLAEDEVVSGVEYCHRNMIIHHDLRPENLLLDSEHNIKLTGFAFSKVMWHDYFLKSNYGSTNYTAPDVWIWSFLVKFMLGLKLMFGGVALFCIPLFVVHFLMMMRASQVYSER